MKLVPTLFLPALSLVILMNLSCGRILEAVTPWLISDEQETDMGNNFYDTLKTDQAYPPYTKNSAVNTYVTTLGNLIVSNQDDRPENSDFQYNFHVINNDTVVNAFAIPGGHVFVYTGLLLNATNGAEVAGVIAHEIAHISKRHGAKRLVEAYGIDFCLSLIAGDGNALRTALDLAAGMMFLKFSRENEEEADSCGVEYVIASNYSPAGFVSFFESLGVDSSGAAKLFEPFSTHPKTIDRINAVESQINSHGSVPSNLHTTDFAPIKSILQND